VSDYENPYHPEPTSHRSTWVAVIVALVVMSAAVSVIAIAPEPATVSDKPAVLQYTPTAPEGWCSR
jgi:flagellar basal body-associated protein FliL